MTWREHRPARYGRVVVAEGDGLPKFRKNRWPVDGPVRELLEFLDELDFSAGRPTGPRIEEAIGMGRSLVSLYLTGTRLITRDSLDLLVDFYGGDRVRARRLHGRANAMWDTPRRGAADPGKGTGPGPVAARLVVDVPDPEPRDGQLRPLFDHLIMTHTGLFAGRQAEISKILEFVRKGDGGYVFVEGLSGYGKTSLLAHLVKTNSAFVYHFISQAYKASGSSFDPTAMSALMANLCEQLGAESVPSDDPRMLQILLQRALFRAAPRPIVIVIDAIDEVDQHPNYLRLLLPRPLPLGYTIIISARTQGDRTYLSDVGLSAADVSLRIELGGLGEDTVGVLLKLAGGAAGPRAHDRRFVEKLHRQSEGDPFYLRFLVEDVARGLLHEGNVEKVPSGLEGYLDEQLSQLNRSSRSELHRDIFGIILEEDGAVPRADLIAMIDGLDEVNFNDTVRDIHRFLLVHDNQYSVCHSRFKEWFLSLTPMGSRWEH